MSEKWVLFDLDGTLLPMDQEIFTKSYFKGLASKLAPFGYQPSELINAIWAGTADMYKNDGKETNEKVFWNRFLKLMGENAKLRLNVFDEYYEKEFDKVKDVCGYNPDAAKTVALLKKRGYKIGLATNPIFPSVATEARIRWSGFKPSDFEFYTTYENSYYCKPSLMYYKSILDSIGAKAEDCIMVGNDVTEDMVAEKLGMKVFLLTDCMINKKNEDISRFQRGGFSELIEFLS